MKSSNNQRVDSSTKHRKDIYRSSRILRSLLNVSSEALVAVDEDDVIAFANEAACRLWGYDDSAMDGLHLPELFSPQFEFIQTGQPFSAECMLINVEARHCNGSFFSPQLKIQELQDDGHVFRVFTAQPNNPEEDNEVFRQRSAAFESMERFASGLAHDLNNVLTGVLGNIHLAMEESGRRGRLQPALLEAAHNASLRARELTKELLEFANSQQPEACAVNLQQVVRENCLIALSGSRTKCEFDFAEDLEAAFIDPAQLGQVIHQLVTFAADATGHSGEIQFHAENRLVESPESAFGGEIIYGNYIAFSMEIPLQLTNREVERFFEPYSQASQFSSGLSLAISRSVIKRNHGILIADAEADKLKIEMHLPASVDLPQETFTPVTSGVLDTKGAKVLVVDDQQLVRLVLQRSLEGLGHRVTTCADGEEAIEAYIDAMENGDRFDVAFLDVYIPGGMGGGETCRKLLEIDPDAACVVISGNTTDDLMTNYQDYGFIDHLSKPFDVDTLGLIVETVAKECRAIEFRTAEEDEEDPIALPFSDNIVEIDFSSPDRY
tara:strand:- start:9293 stop:10948 length:1656 start_codon:yes stop_codon:yes gene_type:complete